MALFEEHCAPIEKGSSPMDTDEASALATEIPAWTLRDAALTREWTLKDFRAAMAMVDHVADLAEEEQHHPDIYVSYNKVRLELSTHKIGGLSRNDFILAAKIDRIG
ncbi:MAG TPA: 4a-hydroxytetrahydrobiopterin dehydratase [Armatimonadota bacterium]|jgi:4a-hydroxytetrahydrobiopterin dehydratase